MYCFSPLFHRLAGISVVSFFCVCRIANAMLEVCHTISRKKISVVAVKRTAILILCILAIMLTLFMMAHKFCPTGFPICLVNCFMGVHFILSYADLFLKSTLFVFICHFDVKTLLSSTISNYLKKKKREMYGCLKQWRVVAVV